MSLVSLQGIHKSYGNHIVLRDANLSVDAHARIGVVGSNGAGKSTLARLVAGIEAPDGGVLQVRRGARILYLDQTPRFSGDPTAEEAVLSGLGPWLDACQRHQELSEALAEKASDSPALLLALSEAAEAVERLGGWQLRHRALALLQHLGMGRPDARISTMSGGEQRRVSLARLLISNPDLAVLDEPTNHLDAESIEWLEKHLIDEYTGAVLLITHDRYLLDRVAQRTLEVANGEVYAFEGGYERYLEQKSERLAHAERVERNRQNFLRRELEWLRRMPKARTTKQAARVERAQAALSSARPQAEKTASFAVDVARSGKTILDVRGLCVALSERILVRHLDLSLTEGERVGIVGPNGAGKTTLLRTLLGELAPRAGQFVVGQNTRIAYLQQQRTALEEDKTLLENVMHDADLGELGALGALDPRTYLERFGFQGEKLRQPVGSLSGGERARVALARLLRQSTNLIVLDEPTNDLDVATLSALEELLVDFALTALIVTHDRWFLDRVATQILAFEGEGKVTLYPGNYESYRALRAASLPERIPSETSRETPRVTRERVKPSKKGLSFAERRELDGIMDAISQAETRVVELTAELGDPATYAERAKSVPELEAELEARKHEAERLIARWEELESRSSLS